jgi:adenine phosphoribosyltransferase
MIEDRLRKAIRDVPDFPRRGIVFKDITTLIKDPAAFNLAVAEMEALCRNLNVDKVVAAEARGFIFGAPLALKMNAGFVPARKPGKLPAPVLEQEFQLEYGTDRLAIHCDAISRGDRVLIVDDLLATGGTVKALADLVERMGARVAGLLFLVELSFLKGRERLGNYTVLSVIRYDAE